MTHLDFRMGDLEAAVAGALAVSRGGLTAGAIGGAANRQIPPSERPYLVHLVPMRFPPRVA